MKKTNFNSQNILNKKFSVELSGYNAKEVDIFLDKILDDYQLYEEQVLLFEKLLNEKEKLVSEQNEEIEKLKLDIFTIKEHLKVTGKATNIELLDEIRSLKESLLILNSKKNDL